MRRPRMTACPAEWQEVPPGWRESRRSVMGAVPLPGWWPMIPSACSAESAVPSA